MTAVATPERSVDQRMLALEHANEIRLFRVQLKRAVKENWQEAARALAGRDERLESMRVYDLLSALWGFGPTRVMRLMAQSGVSLRKTIGGLTARQRSALLLELARTKNGRLPCP